MSEFAQGLGYLFGLVVACAGVTFGFRAGLELGHYLFGPFKISFNLGPINVKFDNAATERSSKT